MSNKLTSKKPEESLNAIKNNNHAALHHLWLPTMTFSLAEVKLYKSITRSNYRVKAQYPHKMWQYVSRCLPQLFPASWRKEQLELLPAACWRPTGIQYLIVKLCAPLIPLLLGIQIILYPLKYQIGDTEFDGDIFNVTPSFLLSRQ